jgi:phospholipid/cholesterol/gamma-HCH transport system ATP-binding protein
MELKIRGLRKSFGELKVLDGVDLDIHSGELFVIVGRSGQGKSVLLKHLVGLIQPDAGEILVDGTNIVGFGERQLIPIRKRFGMIFQSAGLLQSLTVGENVGLALEELDHLAPEEQARIVAEKLEIVGLAGREKQMPATLSGGQRKRVATARALATKADCLLFDEPTAGLDPPMAANVDEIIREVTRSTGATAIVVTHDLVSVFELADRVCMLDSGKIAFLGTPAELRASGNPVVREFLSREIPAPSA